MAMSTTVRTIPSLACALAAAFGLAAGEARAQETPVAEPPATTEPAPAAPETAPALPPPVDEVPAPEEGLEEPPAPPRERRGLSAEELAQIKAQLREELGAELKADLESDLEAVARDATAQRAAALEWEEERWVEEVRPKLNFLEFNGYFRTRADFFNRLDLGTYDPIVNRGTSGVPPPTMYRPFDGEGCVLPPEGGEFGENPAAPGQPCRPDAEDTSALFGMNMRLRVNPVFHISEDIRILSTVDILDNLVLGSTPEAKPGFANNPTLPLPVFSSGQLPPQAGFNFIWDAVRIRRLWAEVMTPFGQLRFGRQPQHFGLGLIANAGNELNNNFGDDADQIMFATRIAGHIIAPAYSISSTGPVGRGGGAGNAGDVGLQFYPGEQGQRYNLDPSDDVHSFLLTVAKVDKDEDRQARLRAGDVVLNYGAFGVYRTQRYDVPGYYADTNPETNPVASINDYVVRNANAGIASLWGRLEWNKLRVEAEAVGIVALIEGTSLASNGLQSVNDRLTIWNEETSTFDPQPLWVLQGGLAFESSYRFLNDSLVAGLNFGAASGDSAPGFGLRPVLNQTPRRGDLDGQQFGACLDYDAGPDGVLGTQDDRCVRVDNTITNFRFDPDYQVDLILFREILGTVTDAVYVKPHVTYYITDTFGVRGDVIYSNALNAGSTPGQQSPLGLEADGTAFYGSDDGFYVMLQGGVLFPLAGLSHARDPNNLTLGRQFAGQRVAERFLDAQWAYTIRAFAGVQF
jgi:uncharacterized protein (TIGR04551 family)